MTKSREHDIVYEPRTGTDMEKATLHKVPIHKYSELCDLGEKHGATRLLASMFKQGNSHIILLQDPKDMSSGHWISVSRDLPRKRIYFFSTYGGRPDEEKIQWMNEDDLRSSGQFMNIFSDSMRELQKHGWEIHYNDYEYQKPGDNTATCGIYTAAFLRSGGDPDEFHDEVESIKRTGQDPAVYFYDLYFH